jgi:hypothetical protein
MERGPDRVELTPEQSPEVAAEVAAALGPRSDAPDPWWQAGLEEQLRE